MATELLKGHQNWELNTDYRKRCRMAMLRVAQQVANEDPQELLLPKGYDKGTDDITKKQALHQERQMFSIEAVGNPTFWGDEIARYLAADPNESNFNPDPDDPGYPGDIQHEQDIIFLVKAVWNTFSMRREDLRASVTGTDLGGV